jgi:hypothetical protein
MTDFAIPLANSLPSVLPPALSALGVGYPIPASSLDMTGVNDNSAIVLAAFALSANGVVELPATNPATQAIRLTNLVIPSGCKLVGSGKLVMDRSTFAWSGLGTLVKGVISGTGSTNWAASDFTVDSFVLGSTAFQVRSDASKNFRISRMSFRANDHSVLLEKNLNTGNPTTDALGAVVNNGIVEDCEFYNGPNGLAIKMRGIRVYRCVAFDVTTQAFPVVSDCINGSTTYSRAQDVVFYDCDAIGCGQPLHVYSRDNFSTNNANGVLGAKNIRWKGGRLAGAVSNDGATIGDSATLDTTLTRIANIDVWIEGADVRDNAQWGLNFLNLNGGGYTACTFGNNNTSSTAGVRNVAYSPTIASGVPRVQRLAKGPCVVEDTDINDRACLQRTVQASATLTSADLGVELNNYLASALVALVMPAPQFGDTYSFYVPTPVGMSIASAIPGTNSIRNGATIATANISSTQAGSTLTLVAKPNTAGVLYWVVTAITGTWTIT